MAVADSGFVNEPLRRTMILQEGNATRRDVEKDYGQVTKGVSWGSAIAKGDIVKLSHTADFAVTKSDTAVWNGSASGAIGVVVSTPEGDEPVISSNGGTYTWSATGTVRSATVEFFMGQCIKDIVIVDAAQAGVVLGWTGSSMSIEATTTSAHMRGGILLESSSAGGTHSVLIF